MFYALRSVDLDNFHGTGSFSRSPSDSQEINRWLDINGFHYNPFAELNASADPHLYQYIVQHSAVDALWGRDHALVFEPKGGGKTTLRVRTAQNCYVGQQQNRPFPISYLPPFWQWGGATPSPDEHLQAILTSAMKQLLISIVYRPHWFLDLNTNDQQLVRSCLERDLAGSLEGFLVLVDADPKQLSLFRKRFDIFLPMRSTPAVTQVVALRRQLASLSLQPVAEDAQARWRLLQEILLSLFHFDSIYLLIDGLDAAPETASDSRALIGSCDFIWRSLPVWEKERIFVKAFLPSESAETLQTGYEVECSRAKLVHIEWTEDLLVEMLVRRIDAATRGHYSSFAAIATPDLMDLERQIVQAASKVAGNLPREVLSLLSFVLLAAARRSTDPARLHYEDLETGIKAYQAELSIRQSTQQEAGQ